MQTSGQRWAGLDHGRKAQCESWQDMFVLQARAVEPEFRIQVFPQVSQRRARCVCQQ